jgi:ArsR family transcriptional regulator
MAQLQKETLASVMGSKYYIDNLLYIRYTATMLEKEPLAMLGNRREACCDVTPALRLGGEEAERLAGLCKALGHPVRLQIVDLLNRYGGRVCVCDIEGQFDLTQPTISHHLKVLREAGLVGFEQRGLWAYYFLRIGAVQEIAALATAWNSAPA